MINRSVARRYARALMDLVEGDPSATSDALSGFAELVESDPTLAQVLSNPLFSLEERRKVLNRIGGRLGWGPPLDRFVLLLIERHRVGYLGAIAEAFSQLVDQRQGRVRVQVTSAAELPASAVDRLQRALAQGLSKEVVVEHAVRPELIAGLTVAVGGLVVDGSLKSQLARLKEQLAGSRA